MVLSHAERGTSIAVPEDARRSSTLRANGDRAFWSILYGDAEPLVGGGPAEQPDSFPDLNLDQVVDALTRKREEYDLRPFLFTPLHSLEQVIYRQGVLRGLRQGSLADCVRGFASGMRTVRSKLSGSAQIRYTYQRASWILDAAAVYCDIVQRFARDLECEAPGGEGWSGLRRYVDAYVTSAAFGTLVEETTDLRQRLAGIVYNLGIRGGTVTVSRYEGEDDYSAEVSATFAKFRQGAPREHLIRTATYPDMNHVEAAVVDRVARLFPDVFALLHAFPERHSGFVDHTLAVFDREVQFYLAYLELTEPLRAAGLPMCTPTVLFGDGDVLVEEAFDLALAVQFVERGELVVCNDVALSGAERILVVTGPNQGGKTTFARMVGQLPYLAGLGLDVPGTTAKVPLVDRVVTQFERGENMDDLSGKLSDDLRLIHGALEEVTERSVVVVNEIFTSTTLDDARFLGREILERLSARGCLAVYVTFVDELASLGPAVVSMVSTVDPQDVSRRTFKVVRRPADGLAYADVLAAKYGLTPDRLMARLQS